MDITTLPPTSILHNHSHLSPLLPSPFANTHNSVAYQHGNRSRSRRPLSISSSFIYSNNANALHLPFTHQLRNGYYDQFRPPADGSCALSKLPDEVMVGVLGYLDWEDLLDVRLVCGRWNDLISTFASSLVDDVTFLSLPRIQRCRSTLPEMEACTTSICTGVDAPSMSSLRKLILRNVKRLHVHLFPYPLPTYSSAGTTRSGAQSPSSNLLALLDAIPVDQLVSLSLPFSAPYLTGEEIGGVLRRIGGKLERLDLRGSGLVGSRWLQWLQDISCTSGGLKELDLGYTSISALPTSRTNDGSISGRSSPNPMIPGDICLSSMPSPDPFRQLKALCLASCTYIPDTTLAAFLADLPPTIERLDLSRLEAVSFEALWHMRVVHSIGGEDEGMMMDQEITLVPTALNEIKLIGIDHLTRLDIRQLKRHWEQQRSRCFPSQDTDIVMSYQEVASQPPCMSFGLSTPPSQITSNMPPSPPTTPGRGTPPTLSPAPRFDPQLRGSLQRVLTYSPPEPPSEPFLQSLESAFPGSRKSIPIPTKVPNAGRGAVEGVTAPFGLPTPPPSEEGLVKTGLHKGIDIHVIHSAILESEDEAGYRQFIGEVAGAQPRGEGHLGLGIH